MNSEISNIHHINSISQIIDNWGLIYSLNQLNHSNPFLEKWKERRKPIYEYMIVQCLKHRKHVEHITCIWELTNWELLSFYYVMWLIKFLTYESWNIFPKGLQLYACIIWWLIIPPTCMYLHSINTISLDESSSCNSISCICYLSWINTKNIHCWKQIISWR